MCEINYCSLNLEEWGLLMHVYNPFFLGRAENETSETLAIHFMSLLRPFQKDATKPRLC